jgi:hypothetical protein
VINCIKCQKPTSLHASGHVHELTAIHWQAILTTVSVKFQPVKIRNNSLSDNKFYVRLPQLILDEGSLPQTSNSSYII